MATAPPPRPYRVELAPPAERQLRGLDAMLQRRLIRRMEALATNPRPRQAEKLKGGSEDLYRIRVGDYRILDQVEDDRLLILVVRGAHRRESYRYL